MMALQEYLLQSDSRNFTPRRKWQLLADRFTGGLNKPLSKVIWPRSLKHLRRFDHDYSFTRSNSGGLSSMRFRDNEVIQSVQVNDLIPPITRPVTLVTTGPSALEYDWESLRQSGRMIVTVTGGTKFLQERGINPDLLVVTDPDFCKKNGFHVRDAAGIPLVIEYRSAAALHHHFPSGLDDRPVSLIERVNKWYGIPELSQEKLRSMNRESGSPFLIPEAPDNLGRIGWSNRLVLGFYPSSTVAFVALQVLAELGAKDIEIIGMDLGGTQSIYANALPSKLQKTYPTVILPSFLSMKDALEGRGIRINNLSPVCPLPQEIFRSNPN
jgi:hypothetical protein